MRRIGENLMLLLKSPVEPIEDWFCFEDYTLIRIYGFEGDPFRLPKINTRRFFALEFLRQRLTAENENFVKHKKASSLKFVFTLDPFVVKSILVSNTIDQIISSMRFNRYKSLRYDPRGIMH